MQRLNCSLVSKAISISFLMFWWGEQVYWLNFTFKLSFLFSCFCTVTDTRIPPTSWSSSPPQRDLLLGSLFKGRENLTPLVILLHYWPVDPENIVILRDWSYCWDWYRSLRRICEGVSYPLIQLSIWNWLLQICIFLRNSFQSVLLWTAMTCQDEKRRKHFSVAKDFRFISVTLFHICLGRGEGLEES